MNSLFSSWQRKIKKTLHTKSNKLANRTAGEHVILYFSWCNVTRNKCARASASSLRLSQVWPSSGGQAVGGWPRSELFRHWPLWWPGGWWLTTQWAVPALASHKSRRWRHLRQHSCRGKSVYEVPNSAFMIGSIHHITALKSYTQMSSTGLFENTRWNNFVSSSPIEIWINNNLSGNITGKRHWMESNNSLTTLLYG